MEIKKKNSHYFIGEFVTFKCDMNEGRDTDWYYEIKKGGRDFVRYSEYKDYTLEMRSTDRSGKYQCYGSSKWSDYTKNSNTVSVTVLGKSSVINNVMTPAPKALYNTTIHSLSHSYTGGGSYSCSHSLLIPFTFGLSFILAGSVTLTCSVNSSSSSGWKYYWYRDENSSEPLTTQDAVFHSNGQISVSQEGLYRCRGGRGNPVYYTEDSQSVRIDHREWLANPRAGHPWIRVITSICQYSLCLYNI
uniref:Ig-like domain-containing protein n=1 Tax=Astatotilapia calliptera TaxID=8154 RepID=A0A3P8NJC5_ASTCA